MFGVTPNSMGAIDFSSLPACAFKPIPEHVRVGSRILTPGGRSAWISVTQSHNTARVWASREADTPLCTSHMLLKCDLGARSGIAITMATALLDVYHPYEAGCNDGTLAMARNFATASAEGLVYRGYRVSSIQRVEYCRSVKYRCRPAAEENFITQQRMHNNCKNALRYARYVLSPPAESNPVIELITDLPECCLEIPNDNHWFVNLCTGELEYAGPPIEDGVYRDMAGDERFAAHFIPRVKRELTRERQELRRSTGSFDGYLQGDRVRRLTGHRLERMASPRQTDSSGRTLRRQSTWTSEGLRVHDDHRSGRQEAYFKGMVNLSGLSGIVTDYGPMR